MGKKNQVKKEKQILKKKRKIIEPITAEAQIKDPQKIVKRAMESDRKSRIRERSVKRQRPKSKYKYVNFDKGRNTFPIRIYGPDGRDGVPIRESGFKDEIEAALRVNEICREKNWPIPNPEVEKLDVR